MNIGTEKLSFANYAAFYSKRGLFMMIAVRFPSLIVYSEDM